MDTKCISLIEQVQKTYSIDGLTEFLSIEAPVSPILSFINIYDNSEHIAQVGLTLTSEYIEIGMAERISTDEKHKGIVKKIIQIIVCKGVELNLPINFRAMPDKRRNVNKLYKYYNTIGFTRRNKNNNGKGDSISYNTSVRNLKKIVNSLRKTRKRRTNKFC